MGCKASTEIRENNNTTKNTNGFRKPVTPKEKSVSPVRASTPKAASPRAVTPTEKQEEEVVVETTPSPVVIVSQPIEETEQIATITSPTVEEEAPLPTEAEIVTTTAPVEEVPAVVEAPKEEEQIVVEEEAPAAAIISPCFDEEKPKKKRRNSKKKSTTTIVDAENVVPIVAKKTEAAAPKRAFGEAVINTVASQPVTACDVTPAKKAVTFNASTKSFDQKKETPLVSRKAKKNVGVRSQSGKANMQMDVYLQQCAAFERLLTNVNTFEKQMNSR